MVETAISKITDKEFLKKLIDEKNYYANHAEKRLKELSSGE
ncbi:MAG: hypothetical protein ACXAB7_19750 [Candidatus Kariarchaeaceae archaeon]|jgi:hypothetical protein